MERLQLAKELARENILDRGWFTSDEEFNFQLEMETRRKWKELMDLAKMCVENDVVICCDEVWGEIVLPFADTPFVSMLSLIEEVEGLEERLVVLTSPSKVFNIAGLDLAYAVIPNPELRMKFKKAGADKSEIPHFGFDACEVAYTDRSVERWRRELV